MLRPIERFSYLARQGTRVAWYMGHYFASRRVRDTDGAEPEAVEQPPPTRGPSRETILAGMGRLFARDLANVEEGLYPMPRDGDGISEAITTSRRFFRDLPRAAERREAGRGDEIVGELTNEAQERYPDYFLQNFHYQTGGYLTEESAKLYDMQVEVLFSGTANAMRRQCLVPIARFIKGRDQRRLSLLDVGSGTGRFLRAVKEAFPRLEVTGIDLSASYLDEAQRYTAPYRVNTRTAAAEALPFGDASFDIVTSIYLFHELPPDVRRAAVRESARVLKPGGLFVFMDSLQIGDDQEFDGLLQSFPHHFHEPYYASYTSENLAALFAEAGLETQSSELVFLSKMMVFAKA